MIRVLITDDDKLARKGLISIMPWANHDMTVVGEAANGKKALEFLAANEVDLVFVDLAMPVLSGIDMMQEARALYPDLQFVVLTFHEDFEYVQATFRIGGVLDYLSKARMDMEDCDAIFERIEQKFRSSRRTAETNFAAAERHAREPGVVPRDRARRTGEGPDAVAVTASGAPEPHREQDWQRIAQEWDALFWLFDEDDLEELQARLAEFHPSARRIERLMVRIATRLEASVGCSAVAPEILNGLRDAFAWLEGVRNEATLHAAGSQDQNSMLLCMLRAVRYVDQHLEEPLHADAVATYINFSRSYFSQCFKKIVGRTFNETVRRKRMRAAKSLLVGSAWSVTRIASAVGYGDVKYFSQQFHRETGCLPTEYRMKNAK